jgi:hypothetical protein
MNRDITEYLERRPEESERAQRRDPNTVAADVYCWRMEQLVRAGYSDVLADCIAQEHTVDLHQALNLIRDGCAPETAARILL